MKVRHFCPACGFELDFEPWKGCSASDEICPCCGIQFGYDDFAGSNDRKLMDRIYIRWRKKWIETGMIWWSEGRKPPREWNPSEQLRKAFKEEN
ncbi:MAG: hypothetical protein DWQ01_07680 [Planctomycetota bacterium]|nr:MAG: hypothetical protein DWQ01_07680 [Planctomycetota bacterium]